MDGAEEGANLGTAKDSHPHHPQQKRRAGVVAESQQPLGFRIGDVPLTVEFSHRAGTHGVATDQPQKEGGGPVAADPEEDPHHLL